METYNFIALGGISMEFYQSQNYGTARGLVWTLVVRMSISEKYNHWQNHCTKVAHLWATWRSWTTTNVKSYCCKYIVARTAIMDITPDKHLEFCFPSSYSNLKRWTFCTRSQLTWRDFPPAIQYFNRGVLQLLNSTPSKLDVSPRKPKHETMITHGPKTLQNCELSASY